MGGMLVTAFLPVYVSAKKRARPARGATAYASKPALGSWCCSWASSRSWPSSFAEQVIWTQSFQRERRLRRGPLGLLLPASSPSPSCSYALSSIISGVLNAERDYLWSTAAPIANNVVTTASFLAYGLLAGL